MSWNYNRYSIFTKEFDNNNVINVILISLNLFNFDILQFWKNEDYIVFYALDFEILKCKN